MARTRLSEFQVRDEDFLSEDEAATISGALKSQIDAKPDTLIELTDTPSGYDDGKYLKSTAAGTEWATVSGGSSAGGGISWTVVSGTSINCVKDTGYLINASNNDVLLHLPTTPSEGDTVGFCDFYNKATSHTITISGSNNIEGYSEPLVLNMNGAGFNLVYTDATRGWEIVDDIAGGDNSSCTSYRYVDRGDPSAWDWDLGDLTTDGAWHDLDCSSIVSSDATAILFRFYIKDDAAGNTFQARKNGLTNSQAVFAVKTQVANIVNDVNGIIACDSSQVIEYWASNTTWTGIYIQILGWFTEGGSTGGDVCADSDISDNKLIRGDGGAKKIQECSTITVSDNGEMVNTGQPCFSVYLSGNQSNITAGSWVTVEFDTESFDQGNNFNTGTYTFTAPVTGKYLLTVILRLHDVDTAASFYGITIVTSNKTYYLYVDPNFTGDLANYPVSLTVIADMDINDTAIVRFIQSGGANQADVFTDSYFTGALIC
jgi:hypothetical protein